MKILFVTTKLNGGGGEKVSSLLLSQWSSDHEIRIVCTSDVPTEDVYDKSLLPFTTYIGIGGSSFFKKAKRIRNVAKSFKPDIVLSFFPSSDFLALYSTRFLKVKRVFSERNDPLHRPAEKHLRILRKYCFNKADAIVFQTEQARDYFSKRIQKKSVIINNPCFPKNKNPEAVKSNRVVALGRLCEQKNFSCLIKAFQIVHESNPALKLSIVGDGSMREELISLIKSLGLEGIAEVLPFSHSAGDLVANSLLLCSSSKFEGIPNVVIEALCMGIPVVGSDCRVGGTRMFIQNGKNGVLVSDIDSPKEYANAILMVAEGREAFHENAVLESTTIVKKCDLEIISKQWVDLMNRIIAGS